MHAIAHLQSLSAAMRERSNEPIIFTGIKYFNFYNIPYNVCNMGEFETTVYSYLSSG
jgi:hypothetical protein